MTVWETLSGIIICVNMETTAMCVIHCNMTPALQIPRSLSNKLPHIIIVFAKNTRTTIIAEKSNIDPDLFMKFHKNQNLLIPTILEIHM